MECPLEHQDKSEILLDYCAQRTGLELTESIRRHVAVCAKCGSFVQSQQIVWDALDRWEDVDVSADFDRNLYRKIEQQQSASPVTQWVRAMADRWSTSSFGWRTAMPLATACAALTAALLLYSPHERMPVVANPSQSQQVSRDSVDLDQVERALDDVEMLRQLGQPASSSSRSL